jgi:hypothetical protein
VYSTLNISHLRWFEDGNLDKRYLRIFLKRLVPTRNDVSFIWDKSWDEAKASELSKAIYELYENAKYKGHKEYGKVIIDHAWNLRSLASGGNQVKRFGLGISDRISTF